LSSLFAAAALLALSATAMVALRTRSASPSPRTRAPRTARSNIEVSEVGCARARGPMAHRQRTGDSQRPGVEIDGRVAPAFRLVSDAPIRINGRDYPRRSRSCATATASRS
jgi:hypothetical protein